MKLQLLNLLIKHLTWKILEQSFFFQVHLHGLTFLFRHIKITLLLTMDLKVNIMPRSNLIRFKRFSVL